MRRKVLEQPARHGERPVFLAAGQQVPAAEVAAQVETIVALHPQDVAQFAQLDPLARLDDGRIVQVVVIHADMEALPGGQRGHLLCLLRVQGHRLFDQHVAAIVQSQVRQLSMRLRRCQNVHQIGLLGFDHLSRIGVGVENFELPGEPASSIAIRVAQRHDLRVRHAVEDLQVGLRDHSAADQTGLDRSFSLNGKAERANAGLSTDGLAVREVAQRLRQGFGFPGLRLPSENGFCTLVRIPQLAVAADQMARADGTGQACDLARRLGHPACKPPQNVGEADDLELWPHLISQPLQVLDLREPFVVHDIEDACRDVRSFSGQKNCLCAIGCVAHRQSSSAEADGYVPVLADGKTQTRQLPVAARAVQDSGPQDEHLHLRRVGELPRGALRTDLGLHVVAEEFGVGLVGIVLRFRLASRQLTHVDDADRTDVDESPDTGLRSRLQQRARSLDGCRLVFRGRTRHC